ncbi:flagellar motor protein MotB [uncultured Umboniibacter sp.]|uniref:flagellar motor protein MotB n=1 Tax=uncultured Umboniibacter sp. TaxID=1798917 RepID=UPI002637CDF6|nr:flagellar motor protein MotB [uncultured Umboniibacter sp.]
MSAPRIEAPEIIIKRVRRGREHDEHHGGGWKVAFADFALAMMALFLVLWVMQVATDEQKSEIANYARTARLLDDEQLLNQQPVRSALLDLEGTMGIFDGHGDAVIKRELNGNDIIAPAASAMRRSIRTREDMLVVADEIRQSIIDTEVSGNLLIEVQSHGVRLVLRDDDALSMFPLGGTVMNPVYRRLLENLAPTLNRNDNDIMISGHTDSRPFSGDGQERSNFELSSERAATARQVLVKNGIQSDRVLMVSGLADNIHVEGTVGNDEQNRRIEIYILNKEASDFLRSLHQSDPYFAEDEVDGDKRPISHEDQRILNYDSLVSTISETDDGNSSDGS